MTRKRDRGLAFLSVLSTLAIGASLVAAMIGRSDARMLQVTDHRDATQAALIAEGALMTVERALVRDGTDAPDVDHMAEPWFTAGQDRISLEGGAALSVELVDLTGRLDLNALGEAGRSETAIFARAFSQAGIPPALVPRIGAFIRDSGPIREVADLAALGLSDADLARLSAVATALPTRELINLNTAPPAVLAALFPQPGLARRLLAERDRTGQISAGDIRRLGGLPPAGVGWTTRYVAAAAVVELGEVSLSRQLTYARDPDDPSRISIINHSLSGQ